MFEDKLFEKLTSYSDLSITDLLQKVYMELVEYHKSDSFDDDICILGMEIK